MSAWYSGKNQQALLAHEQESQALRDEFREAVRRRNAAPRKPLTARPGISFIPTPYEAMPKRSLSKVQPDFGGASINPKEYQTRVLTEADVEWKPAVSRLSATPYSVAARNRHFVRKNSLGAFDSYADDFVQARRSFERISAMPSTAPIRDYRASSISNVQSRVFLPRSHSQMAQQTSVNADAFKPASQRRSRSAYNPGQQSNRIEWEKFSSTLRPHPRGGIPPAKRSSPPSERRSERRLSPPSPQMNRAPLPQPVPEKVILSPNHDAVFTELSPQSEQKPPIPAPRSTENVAPHKVPRFDSAALELPSSRLQRDDLFQGFASPDASREDIPEVSARGPYASESDSKSVNFRQSNVVSIIERMAKTASQLEASSDNALDSSREELQEAARELLNQLRDGWKPRAHPRVH